MKQYVAFGELLRTPEIIDYRTMMLLVRIARHGRLSRVKRHGRMGHRRWVMEPRNKAEQFKRPGRLKK